MSHYVVRVSYDWVIPTFRDVEIVAASADDAVQAALDQANRDGLFWAGAIECDGEAGETRAEAIDMDSD
jgi:hypothetical protein